MRPTRRIIRQAVEAIEHDSPPVVVETNVRTIEEADDLQPDLPEGATRLVTESDTVTVYATDS